MTFFNIRHRSAAMVDRAEEIEHVPAGRGSGIQFDVGFRQIFWILLAFEYTVEVNWFGRVAMGNKVRTHGAGLERTLFAINEQRPRVVRIRGRTPGPMLPHGVETVVLESRR